MFSEMTNKVTGYSCRCQCCVLGIIDWQNGSN